MELWLILSLIYPAFFAITNVIDKFLLEKRIKDVFSLLFIVGIISFIAALFVLFIVPLKNMTATVVIFCLLSGIVTGIGYYLYYWAMIFEEASRVVGVMNVTPILVALFSVIFLGEILPFWKYFAIVIVVVGAIMLGIDKFELKTYARKGFWIMIFSCFFWAGARIFQKYVLGYVSFWNLFVLESFAVSVVLCLTILKKKTRENLGSTLKSSQIIIFSVTVNILGVIISLWAISLGSVSLVSALSSVQPLYVLFFMIIMSLFVSHILKEVISKKTLTTKIVAIFLIVVGTFLVAL